MVIQSLSNNYNIIQWFSICFQLLEGFLAQTISFRFPALQVMLSTPKGGENMEKVSWDLRKVGKVET